MSLRGFEEFGDLPPCQAMPTAKAAALRALEIDPASTESHLWLGVVSMLFDWDRSRAEAELKLATESGQNSIAQLWYAVFLASNCRFEESTARILRTQALDPLSLPVHQTVARCYAWAGEYEKALEQLRVTQQMEPHHPLTYAWLGRVFVGMGRFQDALTEVHKGMEVIGRLPLLLQLAGVAYGQLGRQAEAGAIVQELRELSTRQHVSPMYQAYVLGAMGELDEAFRMYDRSVEQRSGLLALLNVTHENASHAVRSDPRFAALSKKVGLEE